MIVSLIPIVIGVVLAFHGVRGVKETLEARKYGLDSWGINLCLSVLSLVFGVICIFDAFGIMEKAIVVVGVILVYNGLSNIWIVLSGTHAAKKYARSQEPIDVTFTDETDGV